MVCETQKTAERFAHLGRDMPMCVCVYHSVLKHPFHGPGSAWSRNGAPVDIDNLRDVPLWSQATQVTSQYILMERTDLQL